MPRERKYATERRTAYKTEQERLAWKRYARLLERMGRETDGARLATMLLAKVAHEARYGVKHVVA
jgi:hypothetical protein